MPWTARPLTPRFGVELSGLTISPALAQTMMLDASARGDSIWAYTPANTALS